METLNSDALENPMEEAEALAIEEEEFDRIPALDGAHGDSGYSEENSVYAESVEAGAGARHKSEDVAELGIHIEESGDS